MAGRPPTGRVPTAARGTSYGRMGTAAGGRLMTGRLPTGAVRPGTQAGQAGIALSVADRPMTQAGVGIPRTAVASSYRRTVEDESYYIGLLRKKNNELGAEIKRLKDELASHERDHGNYQSYEKRAEALAAEIKKSQGELADLNLMSEHLDHHVEVQEVLEERAELKAKNDRDQAAIDEVFEARRKLEADVVKCEGDIEAVKAEKDKIVEHLKPDQLAAYQEMRSDIDMMGEEIRQKQRVLDDLNAKTLSFERELSENPIKREAIKLHEQIANMEQKRNNIAAEIDKEKALSPEEQRNKLLAEVKEDNHLIAGMEAKIKVMETEINDATDELQNMEEDNTDAAIERKAKYLELQKREKEMLDYLDEYNDNYRAEQDKMDGAENRIVQLLAKISEDTVRSGALPDRADVDRDRKALELKQRELNRSEQTANSMADKNQKLTRDLNNVQNLEVKITSELSSLKDKIEKMRTELVTYDDVAGLKEVSEEHKKRLLTDKKRLMLRRGITKRSISEKQGLYDKSKADLAANESHVQLVALERKWQQLEKQKYSMDDFIKAKEAESYFKPYVAEVTGLIKEYNKRLRAKDTHYKPSVAV